VSSNTQQQQQQNSSFHHPPLLPPSHHPLTRTDTPLKHRLHHLSRSEPSSHRLRLEDLLAWLLEYCSSPPFPFVACAAVSIIFFDSQPLKHVIRFFWPFLSQARQDPIQFPPSISTFYPQPYDLSLLRVLAAPNPLPLPGPLQPDVQKNSYINTVNHTDTSNTSSEGALLSTHRFLIRQSISSRWNALHPALSPIAGVIRYRLTEREPTFLALQPPSQPPSFGLVSQQAPSYPFSLCCQ
jgi:hypothetical protein